MTHRYSYPFGNQLSAFRESGGGKEESMEANDEDWDAIGEPAIFEAKKEWGHTASFTTPELSVIRLLSIARDYDWATDRFGQPVVRKPKGSYQQSAMILHRRGVKQDDGQECDHCKKSGAWISCVSFPSYQGRAAWHGSCSNCTFNARGVECSLRASLRLDTWRNQGDALIIEAGGLLSVIKKNFLALPRPSSPCSKPNISSDSPLALFEFADIGCSRNPPSHEWDGKELRWPIPAAVWASPCRLQQAVADLSSFASICRARLVTLGVSEESDRLFWANEVEKLRNMEPDATPVDIFGRKRVKLVLED